LGICDKVSQFVQRGVLHCLMSSHPTLVSAWLENCRKANETKIDAWLINKALDT
jgi:hypothetical protein